MKLEAMLNRAMELKQIESDAAEERKKLEDCIFTMTGAGKQAADHGTITIQEKTKDTWQPEQCKLVAQLVPIDTFYKLFKVSFTGQKREITKYLAESDNQDVRELLRSACVTEPARPYFKYDLEIDEATA